jgi:hypothetical protein
MGSLARCLTCKRVLDEAELKTGDCVHHSGTFVVVPSWPRNAAPISGTQLGWSCCFSKDAQAPGCTCGPHIRDNTLDAALRQFSPTRPGVGEIPEIPQAPPVASVDASPERRERAASLPMPTGSTGLPPSRVSTTESGDGAEGDCVLHTVGALDTLVGLALRYRCTVESILRVNGLAGPHAFATRKTLLMPCDQGYIPDMQATSPPVGGAALERTLALRKLRSEARLRLGEGISQHEAALYLDATPMGLGWMEAFKELEEDVAWERSQGNNRQFALRRFGASPRPPGATARRRGEALPVSISAGSVAEPPALAALRQPLLAGHR